MAERKKYIDVEIPIMNTTMKVLGTPEQLDQKTIKLDLTRKLRGKGLTITLQIFNKEGKLIAAPKKMELVKSYIQRMMRKRVDYVEDSFQANTADLRVTIKPFLITRKRVSRAVRRNLRNTAREFLIEYIKETEYNDICKEILNGSLQKELLPKLKKVYPLSFCDLRVFETKEIANIDLTKIIEEEKEETTDKVKEEKTEEIKEEESEEATEEEVVEAEEEVEEATEENEADSKDKE